MAMTLRLSAADTEALRARAEAEGRSMQDIAQQAVRAYVSSSDRREFLDRILESETVRYADALDRLGR